MRSVIICLIILIIAVVINWAREGEGFHIMRVFPFLGGDPIDLYDIGGIGLLIVLMLGIHRLKQNRN